MAKLTPAQINERWEIGVAIGIIILILLLAYLNGAMQQSLQPPPSLQSPSAPNQPNIWSPALTMPSINVTAPPANQYNVGNGVTCGCGCNNQSSFATLDQMIAAYNQQLANVESGYYASMIAMLPSYISQYVNNLTGFAEGLKANAQLQ
jgi:hypothetical protein